MKEIINYPTTKAEWQEWLEDIENQLLEQGRIAEWQEWLEDIENQLLEQGRIVDARLLKKRDQLRDIINTWEDA